MNSTKPPVAKSIPKELTMHGHRRLDHYYWLNDREDKEVIQYLEAENTYTEHMTADVAALKEDLFQEIKNRIKEQDISVPYQLGDYLYYSRYEVGNEYPIYCRKKNNPEAKEEVILDVNEIAADFSYFDIGGLEVSPDQTMLAYGADTVGRRFYNIFFKNLSTGELLQDAIKDVTGNLVWALDNKTVFYSKQDDQTLRPNQIYRHVLGEPKEKDVLVFEEKDEAFHCGVSKTKSKKYILIQSHSTTSSEIRLIEANQPTQSFSAFLMREKDHEYHIEHFDGYFYIITNDKAKNSRLMKVAETQLGDKSKWQEVISHRNDVLLEDIEIFRDFLVVEERKEGLLHIRIINWKTKEEHYLNFGEPTYVAGIDHNPQVETKLLRFSYNSLTTPNSVYDYDMEKHSKTLLKQQEVLGMFDTKDYIAERIYATAADGIKIPISLVYKKGLKLDGNNPLYQYAYGSYGFSMDANFSSARLSLLNRGFVFAIAHIRGGQEMGRDWYEDGKLLKKKNTFTDFIACSEYLIQQGYTSKELIFASGGSAGGLLMGAIANMRPDLYKGIIADVPFVDVVTTMLDEDIPLTVGEYEEWGNPNEKAYYDYMHSYSPYDNVAAKAYPNMLITAGLHDSQVQYWEPAKWVAKLRLMKTDDNLLLLKTNMDAGHGGASGRFEPLRDIAFEYAFMLKILGRKE